MVWPFKKKQRQPSMREAVKEETRGHITATEAISPENILDRVQFDFQVIDDEKILMLFDENSPLYCPLVLPLLPLISRLNFLSNISSHEARVFKLRVNIMVARLKNRAESTEEYMLLDGLQTYLHMRINDSREGFKIRVLSERKKTLTLREEEVKKGGWLRR